MAATQEDIDTLNSRVAQLNQMLADGVRQVTIGDQTVTFNTTDSLIRARDDAQAQLTAAQRQFEGRTSPRQRKLVMSSRGYWG